MKQINLIRTAVGISDLGHLADVQRHYGVLYQGVPAAIVTTRNMPTRGDDLLRGGSLYWIIKNRIQCRQRIMGLDLIEDDQAGRFCRIYLDPGIVETVVMPRKAVQGWRYLEPGDAPPDKPDYGLAGAEDTPLPSALEAELRALGLL